MYAYIFLCVAFYVGLCRFVCACLRVFSRVCGCLWVFVGVCGCLWVYVCVGVFVIVCVLVCVSRRAPMFFGMHLIKFLLALNL